MSKLTDAVARLNALLEPATKFTWGTRIYLPDEDDPLSKIKLDLIGQGKAALAAGQEVESGISLEITPTFDNAVFVAIEQNLIGDPEESAYVELAQATSDVVAEITSVEI